MTNDRFQFASAPDSWGVLDYPGPSWDQPYQKMLDEMVEAGYTGTELGPYGFFPTDPLVLRPEFDKRKLKLLGSFVPVVLSDPGALSTMVQQIRKVGDLLSQLGAPFLVLADAQSPQRDRISGRVPADGSQSMSVEQWQNTEKLVAKAADVARQYDLDLVFHPHVATFVETPAEVERFFDVTSQTGIGLCLDTGHCLYGGGDPVTEAKKYRSILRFVHIKDCDERLLAVARRKGLTFDQAIEDHVFTIIGRGSIDFPGFFRTLVSNDYSGWLVVEQDVKFGATATPPAESIAASLRYLHGVVSKLEVSSGL